jgi:hypothetical protein
LNNLDLIVHQSDENLFCFASRVIFLVISCSHGLFFSIFYFIDEASENFISVWNAQRIDDDFEMQ